jgi:hypothetical protein
MRYRTPGYANFDMIPTQIHLRIRTHTLDYSSIRHRTTGYEHLCLKRGTTVFRFVCHAEVNIATEKRLQFDTDTDTDSTTHDWDREAAYEDQ